MDDIPSFNLMFLCVCAFFYLICDLGTVTVGLYVGLRLLGFSIVSRMKILSDKHTQTELESKKAY